MPTGDPQHAINACSSNLRSLRPRNPRLDYPDQIARSVPKCGENPQEGVDRDVKTEFGEVKASGPQQPEWPLQRHSTYIEAHVACWKCPGREHQWLADGTDIASKSVSVRRFRLNSRTMKACQVMSPDWIPVLEALSRPFFYFYARHGDSVSSGVSWLQMLFKHGDHGY